MRRNFIPYVAAGLVAAGLAAASPAEASYRVIKWDGTNFCQVWDYSLPTRPFPADYRVMTKRLRTLDAAWSAKDRLWRHGHCAF